MQAWQVHENGEPSEVMRLEDVARPVPGDGQVLLKVRAGNINFPDVLMCRGHYQVRPPLPFTPGVEICGETEDGRRVIANPALPHGGFAEYAVADAAALLPAPDSLDDAEAAALHIGYQTGWFGLHRRARLEAGETLLVHAAAGGVGSAAVQLGKAAGATVIGVVGGADKAAVARELGCDVVVDRRSEDVVAAVKEATGGRGADVIYDPVGGEAYTQSTKVVAFEGRIVVVGFAAWDHSEPRPQPRPGEELRHPGPALGPVQHQEPQAGPALPRTAHRTGRPRRDQAADQRARAARRCRRRRAAPR